jgi:hypothetical protein
MSNRLKVGLMALLAGGAVLTLAVVALRDPPPPSAQAPLPATITLPAPTRADPAQHDPSFPTPSQATKYYTAMVQGERNALRVVTTSLAQLRTRGSADPQEVQRLEKLLDDYTRRLQRHEAKLAEVRTPSP